MSFTFWYLALGAVFLFMAAGHAWVKRMPLTTSLVYLALGVAIGPYGLGMLTVAPISHSKILERLSEITVIVSLFSAGLKLTLPFSDKRWRLPLNLAFVSMSLTVGLIAIASHYFLMLPWGAAILLGAVLAPTDPVLASDVQVTSPEDQDRLRFSLTAEAGLNDGTAFPFIMLGLGLLGHHELGENGLRWVALDLAWPIAGGLFIGALIGLLIAILAQKVRTRGREIVVLDDFLALSLISLSYGAALAAKAYGFLAVFAAAATIRQLELYMTKKKRNRSSAEMAEAVLVFNEQMERICEVVFVITLGAMLSVQMLAPKTFLVAGAVFLVIRPLSVFISTSYTKTTFFERSLISWFGIRGIGSIYYLMYALQHGLDGKLGLQLVEIVLGVVAISVVVHGISVTPLMNHYQNARSKTWERWRE